ncbi:hypothetical protein EKN06_14835 [Croceicoccus ponticola]|uniref:Uncharacterized protein n=1 Tax=Croceicoccus ponticola TaxID=2217664 RepID=A0A437GU71_9SPHN|nr:hypothetical protein [Croceicoccus ponticola]RVQ64867.1 hypothetical protein EKN06_14835 [Croceicoccus ponticola]
MEDFNSLLLNEQVELLRAQCAQDMAARRMHRQEARNYAKRIEAHAFPYRTPDESGHRLFDAHAYDLLADETAH